MTTPSGTLRTRKKFCWWPEHVGDCIVWLEYVDVIEEYNGYGRWDVVRMRLR